MIKIAQYYDRSPTEDSYQIQFTESSEPVECGNHVFFKVLSEAVDKWQIHNPAVNIFYCSVTDDTLEWLNFMNPNRPQQRNLDAVRAANSAKQDKRPCTGTPGR